MWILWGNKKLHINLAILLSLLVVLLIFLFILLFNIHVCVCVYSRKAFSDLIFHLFFLLFFIILSQYLFNFQHFHTIILINIFYFIYNSLFFKSTFTVEFGNIFSCKISLAISVSSFFCTNLLSGLAPYISS